MSTRPLLLGRDLALRLSIWILLFAVTKVCCATHHSVIPRALDICSPSLSLNQSVQSERVDFLEIQPAHTINVMNIDNFLGPKWANSCHNGYTADELHTPPGMTDSHDIFLPTLEEILEPISNDRNEGYQNNDTEYAQAVRELGVLNAALFKHASKLPSYTLAQAPETPESTPHSTGFTALKPSHATMVYIIEEMFTLTKRFIEVMKNLVSGASRASNVYPGRLWTDGQLFEHNMLQPQELPSPYMTETQVSSTGHTKPLFISLEDATVLLILSCYCRVVDVHISVFEKIQACLQSRTKWALDENSSVELPRLQIGSYSSTAMNADVEPTTAVDKTSFVPFSTASMYMMMIAMLSEDLHSQLREVMLAGLGIESIENSSGIVLSSCEDDKDRSAQEEQSSSSSRQKQQRRRTHKMNSPTPSADGQSVWRSHWMKPRDCYSSRSSPHVEMC